MSITWFGFGFKGWIGGLFTDYLRTYREADTVLFAQSRGDDEASVAAELRALPSDTVVVSFLGRTHGDGCSTIDYLESSGKLPENIRDNLFAPAVISLLCHQLGLHFTYLGTGCIFEYDDDHRIGGVGFAETDKPNFTGSQYSVVKGFTDRLMHLLPSTLNLRIRMPITGRPNSRNFITKIASYQKIISVENSMSVLPTLFPALVSLVQRRITGTLNFCNPDAISHNDILNMYIAEVDRTFTYQNFTVAEQDKILKSRRSNNTLDTSRLSQLCPEIPDIRTACLAMLTEYKDFVHTKTILVTGGCGFIASNYIRFLYDKYTRLRIVNLDSLTYAGDIRNIRQDIRNDTYRYVFVHGDICDPVVLQNLLTTYKPQSVVHFAAETHVDNSFNSSILFSKTNVLGTHTLLQVIAQQADKIVKFIHISTDEVYGGKMDHAVLETESFDPSNPYSSTKAAAESIVNAYRHSFNLPSIIVRMNNVFGPHQYPEKCIPKFILHRLAGQPMTLHGSGNTKRSFIYVEDVVKGIDIIETRGAVHEIYNVGVAREISVLEVAQQLLVKLPNSTAHQPDIVFVPDRPFNDQRYFINSDKLKELGWRIETTFEDGLDQTIQFYKNNEKEWREKINL